VARRADAALPEDRIVAADSTQLAIARQYMPAWRARSWLALRLRRWDSLQAIGARSRLRPAGRAIVGDSGFLSPWGRPQPGTSAPLPIVLWDNRGYGEIAIVDGLGRPHQDRTTAHDFLGIARGFGCLAVRRRHPMGYGRGRAGSIDRPTLIRVSSGS
jgi:thiamine pyrophosphate-dependent acetolactate synthase large subunit-like protein